MAVEKDQSAWLPEPPPPRPARRDAAIDAALRKFDGIDEPAPGARELRPSWARTHRPQMAVMVSALLLMIVGIPAALIGLRNSPSPSERVPPPTAATEAPAPPAQRAPAVRYEPTETPPPIASPVVSPPALKSSGEEHVAFAKDEREAKAARAEVAAPPPATADMASAAPPSPPPPPAPSLQSAPANVAERAMGQQSIIVTGARAANPPAPAIDPAYKAFLSRLQRAVRGDDRQAVIALIGFPLRVNRDGGAKIYPDARSVERDFDRIFTPRVRRAILGQRANGLFVRDQGAMIGDGEVWFDFSCPNTTCSPAGPVAIKAVNP